MFFYKEVFCCVFRDCSIHKSGYFVSHHSELYFRINATGPINSIFWKTITVQNMNLINKETYASRSEYYRVFTAISNGTGKMFDLDIPIGETKVYMKASGVEVYAMKKAMWGRLINFNGNADIN